MQTVHNRLNKLQSYSLPSSQYTNLTLGASGTKYTAPADGWVYFAKKLGASWYESGLNTLIDPQGSGSSVENRFTAVKSTGYDSAAGFNILPVNKGQVFTATYNATGNTIAFKFIYAVGSAPQS